jgi:hypothetical protein
MRSRLLALLLAAVLPIGTVSAQVMVPTMDPFAGSDEGDSVRPITSYPLGQSELVARNMATALRLEQKQRDLCWQLGCVVFVNESKTYMVTGFYVQTAAADGTLSWSRNQFGAPLLAKRATVRFKTGPQSACDLPARFVLRAPHRKQSISYDTRVSLCSSPHQHSLIRIRAAIPEVEVGS